MGSQEIAHTLETRCESCGQLILYEPHVVLCCDHCIHEMCFRQLPLRSQSASTLWADVAGSYDCTACGRFMPAKERIHPVPIDPRVNFPPRQLFGHKCMYKLDCDWAIIIFALILLLGMLHLTHVHDR